MKWDGEGEEDRNQHTAIENGRPLASADDVSSHREAEEDEEEESKYDEFGDEPLRKLEGRGCGDGKHIPGENCLRFKHFQHLLERPHVSVST